MTGAVGVESMGQIGDGDIDEVLAIGLPRFVGPTRSDLVIIRPV